MSTTDPLSEAGIASMAAGLLDDYEITSLNDSSPLGRFMAREFGPVRREMLETHPWYWNGKRVKLVPLNSAPDFGFLAQYQCPSDFLGMRRLYDPDNVSSDMPVPFVVEGDRILCNVVGGINIIYSFDQTLVAKWRALPARAFSARLAMYASQRVTGKASYFDKCRIAYGETMEEAKHSDAIHRGMMEDVYVSGNDGFDAVTVRGVWQ